MPRRNSNAGAGKRRGGHTDGKPGQPAQRGAKLQGALSTGAQRLTKAGKMTPKVVGRKPKRSVNR